jgi:hypothetical protein
LLWLRIIKTKQYIQSTQIFKLPNLSTESPHLLNWVVKLPNWVVKLSNWATFNKLSQHMLTTAPQFSIELSHFLPLYHITNEESNSFSIQSLLLFECHDLWLLSHHNSQQNGCNTQLDHHVSQLRHHIYQLSYPTIQ